MQRKRENEKTRRRTDFNIKVPKRKEAKKNCYYFLLRLRVLASLRFFSYRFSASLFSSAFSASLRLIFSRFPVFPFSRFLTFPLSHFPTFCILVVLCCHPVADAAEKYAGDFLTLGVGARPLGMGGSFAAIADDSTAAYWNPAGLGRLRHSEAAFMHSSLGKLDSYDFVNYVHPIGGAASLGLSWLRVGSMISHYITATPWKSR